MRFLFDDYVLDLEQRELRRGGDLVQVEPQVFDLLAYLVAHRDRVASKDDLLAAVWHGRIVSESTLTSRITAARHAIGDSGEHSVSSARCPAAASGSSARCASTRLRRQPESRIVDQPRR
jgi:DNA-binding winged helix-turn-helix (wHTH) protein